MVKRFHEFGIRMALGARPRAIRAMVMGEAFTLTALGGAVGVIGALAVEGAISALLYGVLPGDLLTIVPLIVVLAGITVLATWLPVKRAVSTDPAIAMRTD